MNQNEDRLKQLLENSVTEEDTFLFGCTQCGECCRNRHDILLSPYDLFRIAGFLKENISSVIEKYCEVYIGQDSRLPVVRAKPKIHQAVCPFLRNGKCSIHAVKPAVCALFPLGRIIRPDVGVQYVLQEVSCNADKTPVKVKDFLAQFGLKESETPAIMWGEIISRLALGKQQKLSQTVDDRLNEMIFLFLYLHYDTAQDFLQQLAENIQKVERAYEDITGKPLGDAV